MKQLLFSALLFSFFNFVNAGEYIDKNGNILFKTFENTESQRLVGLEGNSILKQLLHIKSEESYVIKSLKLDEIGMQHERFQQYYGPFPVEFGSYTLHYKGGKLESVAGEYMQIDNQSVKIPLLSSYEALQKAKAYIKATKYMWEDEDMEALLQSETGDPFASYLPKGELVYVKDIFGKNDKARLAYKLDIYGQQPISRGDVYVDAEHGNILFYNKTIHHVDEPGVAQTRYSGTKSITTSKNGTLYQLKETENRKCETYNMKQNSNYGAAKLFTDNDNNWTSTEYNNAKKDNAALDAHYGAEITWDYWKTIHNRNSYDDKGAIIKSYVHFGKGYDNAFWDGQRMTYGDGSDSIYDAFTALDICAHEIGHGICSNTADLYYEGESGGLNEGFSDIWAACVEYFAGGRTLDQIWKLGEDIDRRDGHSALRVMSNPNDEENPDTYLGKYWYDEVHNTSGVFNYWFYLLSMGGAGVNDNDVAYNVQAITIEKAQKIAYRALALYMTSFTDFSRARLLTIKSAKDLYGNNSIEAISVENAWCAVGICNPCDIPDVKDWKINLLNIEDNSITFTVDNNLQPVDGKLVVTYDDDYPDYDFRTIVDFYSTNTLKIDGLESCTLYDFNFRIICPSGSSFLLNEENNYLNYRTAGCICKPIIDLHLLEVGVDYAYCDFSYTIGADSFQVLYREIGTTNWNVNTETFFLSPLKSATTYEIKVREMCDGQWSKFSDTISFTTLPPLICKPAEYIQLNYASETEAGIYIITVPSSVAQRITYINMQNSKRDQKVADYNSSYFFLSNLTPNSEYMVFVESQCHDSIWYMSDTLYFRTLNMTCISNNNVNIFGEIEPTKATLWWWKIPTVNEYELAIVDINYNEQKYNTGKDTSYTVIGLTPGTDYYARLRKRCNGTWRQWSDYLYFLTPTATAIHQDLKDKIKFSIFPNPSCGDVKLISESSMPNQLITITDVTGKEVYKEILNIIKNVPIALNLKSISKGTYFLHTIFEGNNINQKLIIIE